MSTKLGLLTKGNTKLGRMIGSWSIDRDRSCVGRTKWCAQHCYGKGYTFRNDNVKIGHDRRYDLSTNHEEFENRMIDEIRRRKSIEIVRIHVVGDFYSIQYIDSWIRIIRACPNVKFLAYTRAWRIPKLSTKLEQLRSLKNMILYASIDPTATNAPASWLKGYAGDTNDFGYPQCHGQCGECMHCYTGKDNVWFKRH